MKQVSVIVEKRFPGGCLKSYVSEYVFRVLTLDKGESIVKAMPLRVSGSIDFFLGNSFETLDFNTKRPNPFSRCNIRGPRTHKKNIIIINSDFVSFTVKFKPTGLYRLLGIPANAFCNQSIDGTLILGNLFKEITERLIPCRNIDDCINIIETYLVRLALARKVYASKAIDEMTGLIFSGKVPANITGFYKEVSSSTRQLERNFSKEVGTTPKLYANMVRFENLIRHKIDFPEKKWTTLAYEYNYYDQMHLLKSFKRFLDINPTNFKAENYAF